MTQAYRRFVLQKEQGDGNDLAGRVYNQANAMVLIGQSLAESAERVVIHAERQAQHADELAGAMSQMTASVSEVAASAEQTAGSAANMTKLNEECFGAMEDMSVSVGDVMQAFDQILTNMAKLRETANAVAAVVDLISDIAVQTKMVSLNASIEAAHAGDLGSGFAVVAQEVRRLAEKTGASAREIASVISRNTELTEQVCRAVGAGRETATRNKEGAKTAVLALTAAAAEIETVTAKVQQIAAATRQQSATAENIGRGVAEVARLARDALSEARGAQGGGMQVASIAGSIEQRMGSYELEFLGLAPVEDAVKMNKSFAPLCRALCGVLGRQLRVRLGHDYEDAVREIGTGRALLSYLTPSTYIEARELYGVEPLVVPLARGEPFYRSAIVVRADAGIDSLARLRGRHFAFGDPKSTGSKAMPEAMLGKVGLRLADLAGHGFTGTHDNVAGAVLAGQYDAGGLMLSVAERYVGEGLKILAVSDPIPQFPICASPRLPLRDRKRLVEYLVSLNDPSILSALGDDITGFAPVTDRDYDVVRTMMAHLKD